jgi:CubicO group peptidase (beta-lactamase class C family)
MSFASLSRNLVITAFLLTVAQPSGAATGQSLPSVLESIRGKYHLPALAGAVFTTGRIMEMAVVGVRKAGTEIPVTTGDQWHLGSDAKAMTATLAGTFVAEKRLSWNAPVISFFPDIAGQVPAQIRNITIDQVLRHEAGLAPGDDSNYLAKLSPSGSLIEQRVKIAHLALTSPAYPPGTFHYSNFDYVVIAAILEKIGGKPWEDLMRERIFQPLGMTQAGFGGTGTAGQIDQPWPHFESGQPTPINGSTMDPVPAFLRPAGGIHCTMTDWAKFLIDQLRGGAGMKALLPGGIYQAMQTAGPNSAVGYGWGVTDEPWAGGHALTHAGSNGINFCVCWLAAKKGFGVLVCTNEGGDQLQACNEAASAMTNRYLANEAR